MYRKSEIGPMWGYVMKTTMICTVLAAAIFFVIRTGVGADEVCGIRLGMLVVDAKSNTQHQPHFNGAMVHDIRVLRGADREPDDDDDPPFPIVGPNGKMRIMSAGWPQGKISERLLQSHGLRHHVAKMHGYRQPHPWSGPSVRSRAWIRYEAVWVRRCPRARTLPNSAARDFTCFFRCPATGSTSGERHRETAAAVQSPAS